MHTALTSPEYNKLVWRPDWCGSICFLVSGAIAYRASPRHGWLPAREGAGWWQPAVNLLGCIFFGISAVAGYVVPSTGSMLSQAACNWNTSLGAACFLACALDTLHTGEASKMPRLRRLHELEHALERDVGRVCDPSSSADATIALSKNARWLPRSDTRACSISIAELALAARSASW